MYRLHEALHPERLPEAQAYGMSASEQPMEMKAMVEMTVDKKKTMRAAFETTFVVNDPIEAVERGAQMQQAVTAFIAGFAVEAGT